MGNDCSTVDAHELSEDQTVEGDRALQGKDAIIETLQAQLQQKDVDIADLEAENDRLAAYQPPPGAQLGSEFEFGERVFQCVQTSPGVGYRFTPQFADKNQDGSGPVNPQVIIADAMCQGPRAIFVHCTSGRGWLPLTNPNGMEVLFVHLGRLQDVDINNYQLNDGRVKLTSATSFFRAVLRRLANREVAPLFENWRLNAPARRISPSRRSPKSSPKHSPKSPGANGKL
eukprot:TRINITY_DN14648_c0_g1_i3.p1 TRINITY_DN14648_c0_g1~~TRINITY_DN14648_c0_g1_i3.p1  ORF type:complete len:229 (+),score=36.87 TRINITY_DN14648_c0_g1_i3:186-872(+)